MNKSHLYIVATPIGNLEDITLRAIRILKEVDIVFCEDTRTTRILFAKYDISTPTESFHAQSSDSKTERIISLLKEGKNLALVSDAGTPTISDPGVVLVADVRKALLDNVEIVPIPGPSAFVSALSVAGVPAHHFVFLGFLPHKKGRHTLFQEIINSERTYVFYESPHRIEKALEALLGSGRRVTIGRELTKIHEQIISGTPEEIAAYFKENQDKVRGEFVVIVSTFATMSSDTEESDTQE